LVEVRRRLVLAEVPVAVADMMGWLEVIVDWSTV
jgi:hypothetical protein